MKLNRFLRKFARSPVDGVVKSVRATPLSGPDAAVSAGTSSPRGCSAGPSWCVSPGVRGIESENLGSVAGGEGRGRCSLRRA